MRHAKSWRRPKQYSTDSARSDQGPRYPTLRTRGSRCCSSTIERAMRGASSKSLPKARRSRTPSTRPSWPAVFENRASPTVTSSRRAIRSRRIHAHFMNLHRPRFGSRRKRESSDGEHGTMSTGVSSWRPAACWNESSRWTLRLLATLGHGATWRGLSTDFALRPAKWKQRSNARPACCRARLDSPRSWLNSASVNASGAANPRIGPVVAGETGQGGSLFCRHGKLVALGCKHRGPPSEPWLATHGGNRRSSRRACSPRLLAPHP